MPAFPFFKQLDSMDCGPSCLHMVAKFYGKSYSLQSLRYKSFITRSGVSMLGISDAGENIGFRTRGYRLTWEQLRDEVSPCGMQVISERSEDPDRSVGGSTGQSPGTLAEKLSRRRP